MTEDRYFGWMTKSHSLEHSFDITVEGQPLSSDVLQEFNEIVGAVCRLRPTLIEYQILKDELSALQALPIELLEMHRDSAQVILGMGVEAIATHAICERRFSNFLNAASALRDRSLSRLSDNNLESDSLKGFISSIYDQSLAYRLCYNLRNMSQHHEGLFWIIPMRGSGEEGVLEFSFELELRAGDLLRRGRKFQRRLREDLKACEDRIPLLPLSQEYYSCLVQIALFSIISQYPNFKEAIDYKRAVQKTKKNMPPDATPLLFHGPPQIVSGMTNDCTVTSFSFDEIDMIVRLIDEAVGLEKALQKKQVASSN